MELPHHKSVPIGDESLVNWHLIGAGGFGQVYRARHKVWGFDVAIKLLHNDDGSIKGNAIWQEAIHMDEASSPFVLMVHGLYKGCPEMGSSMRLGIVMEFMERGSLQSLQETLQETQTPLPCPLAFRLAHQVALGMNFLHLMTPLLHQDLKPSNVLLDGSLNAKLTDFGLSRVSTSVLKSSSRTSTGENGGTYAYMPPEAFDLSYEPVRAFDIYSYGILLWSILADKEPYSGACFSLVALKVPCGERPRCEKIDPGKADGELVGLMKECWVKEPAKRPPFEKCCKVTERVFLRHKKGIHDAVTQALSKLDSEISYLPPAPPLDTVDHASLAKMEISSKLQDSVDTSTDKLTDAEKAKFVDRHRSDLIELIANIMAITEDLGDMVHPEVYSWIEAEKKRQDKVRVLYRTSLHTGGVTAKAAFYNALMKHERTLLERLGA